MELESKLSRIHPKNFGIFLETIMLAGLTACLPQPPEYSMKVSFMAQATVSNVTDTANPDRKSGDLFFPDIPSSSIGEAKKHITVPLGGFFYARCEGRMIFRKGESEVHNSDQFMPVPSDDGNTLYLFPPSAGDPSRFPMDYNRAYTADKRQYNNHTLKRWRLKIDEEVEKEKIFTDDGIYGGGPAKIIKSSKYQEGPHQISCTFETQGGQVYEDAASIEIIDNRI